MGVVCYLCFGFWLMTWGVYRGNRHNPRWFQSLWLGLWFICGHAVVLAMLVVCSLVAILFMEIANFSFMAFIVWIFLTVERWDYHDKKVAGYLKEMLTFIGAASRTNNDRVIRILAIN